MKTLAYRTPNFTARATNLPGRMHYFALLSPDEQAAAIRRLSLSGMSDHGIASATALSVEAVRRISASAA